MSREQAMRKKPNLAPAAAEQRRRAEARLRERRPEPGPGWTETDTQRLIHELQVHQIELEMQNEELQEARDELEAGLEKYSDLYDFAPVGYLTLGRDATIREANLAGASLLGIERSRLVKRRFGLRVSPASLPGFNAFLARVFEGKVKECCEAKLLREGKPPVEVQIEAVAAPSGHECRVVLEDITDRKRAESDRLFLNQLESAGMLAGGLAHDYTNLLTVIQLNLEMARALIPEWEGFLARRLQTAEQATLQARDLTRQLLTIAQEGGSACRATSLAEIIHAAANWSLSGSPVQCEFSLPESLWPAEVDAGQIGQVFRNLVLNAREAMPRGGLVSIRAENVALRSADQPSLPPGEYVCVSIADKGIGISPEVLPKIFDPYFSTKRRGHQRGMGLGLTICHAVIQKHGGAISVESEVGVGTTFQIHLPAAQQLPQTEAILDR